MKLLKLVSFVSLIHFAISCGEEKDAASNTANCAILMAEMLTASETFNDAIENSTATRSQCEDFVKKYKAYVDCMPAGDEKDETQVILDVWEGMCPSLPS